MIRSSFFVGICGVAFVASGWTALAQDALPPVTVAPPKPAEARPKPAPKPRVVAPAKVAAAPKAAPRRVAAAPAKVRRAPVANAGRPAGVDAPSEAAQQDAAVAAANGRFDAARDKEILTKVGANTTNLGRAAIEALPQGDNAAFDKVLLQLPGVTQDSAASGSFHIRNEHANVQYRINGILVPEGISGFGNFIGTNFIGNIDLLTGALPAQYGLRTSGVLDITSRSGAFDGGGEVGIYGGSRGTIIPSFSYGTRIGDTEVFASGQFNQNNLGIENPLPTVNAIHDRTDQGQFFGYASTLIDPSTRLSFLTGEFYGKFQIPNSPGQVPLFTTIPNGTLDSSQLNENQTEKSIYNVVALQRSLGDVDTQVSFFSRYTQLHFTPDYNGDVVFNGVASDVSRSSFVNGVQADVAYRLNSEHTLRGGVLGSVERTSVGNNSLIAPNDFDSGGDPLFTLNDPSTKTGTSVSAYIQDEWRLSRQLTINGGLRFDQINQYVDAHQLSPRLGAVYTPFEGTSIHAGYARYFTPPPQALAAPTNIAQILAAPPSQQTPEVTLASPVQPERSHYFDIGVDQKIDSHLTVGVDAYYKRSTNVLDDGQFGQALILTAFNYARGYNQGIELKANYENENLRVYGNIAFARQRATQVSSNQFLFEQDEYDYIANNYVHTDHEQIVTASAGVSYKIGATRLSADMVYGSGLRSGFANTDHLPAYTQVNLGVSHEFQLAPGMKPTTFRFDVVNLFDSVYEIRDGSGIGVFAPQYGPRRGFYAGVSQRF